MALTNRQLEAYQYFLDAGLSPSAAAGMVGAATTESGSNLGSGSQGNQSTETGGVLNPNGAFGIYSWNGPRQAGLSRFAVANPQYGSVDSLRMQVMFAASEVQNYGAWGVLSGSTGGITDHLTAIVTDYLRPAEQYRAGNIADGSEVAAELLGTSGSGGWIESFFPQWMNTPISELVPALPDWMGDFVDGGPLSVITNSDGVPVSGMIADAASSPLAAIWNMFLSLIPRIGVGAVGLVMIMGAMYIFSQQVGIRDAKL
jgi:hypothetical protein